MIRRQTTDAFIEKLAVRPVPPPYNPVLTAAAVGIASLLAIGLFLWTFGARADIAAILSVPTILAKTLLPLALSVLALWLALRSGRPGESLPLLLMVVPAGLALWLFAARFFVTPGDVILPEIMGQTAADCLLSISVLTLAPLAAGLAFLRRGASTRPMLSGALIGIASGAAVVSGYALHCTEDSPLFYITWYGLAIGIAGLLGALAGRAALRW